MVCSFVWAHLSEGYSQGMCDLLSPLLVVLEEEPLAHACYLKLMESAIKLFPPNTFMNTRLSNVQALLQVGQLIGRKNCQTKIKFRSHQKLSIKTY